MWAKDGNGAGCNNGSTLAWAAAITFAEGLSFAGYSDWRLPNVKELISIVDYSTVPLAINSTFTNTQSGDYWSSSTGAAITDSAWFVGFDDGGVGRGYKVNPYYVRPVRGGQ